MNFFRKMPRKKPNSGKQKKEQIKNKRQQKKSSRQNKLDREDDALDKLFADLAAKESEQTESTPIRNLENDLTKKAHDLVYQQQPNNPAPSSMGVCKSCTEVSRSAQK